MSILPYALRIDDVSTYPSVLAPYLVASVAHVQLAHIPTHLYFLRRSVGAGGLEPSQFNTAPPAFHSLFQQIPRLLLFLRSAVESTLQLGQLLSALAAFPSFLASAAPSLCSSNKTQHGVGYIPDWHWNRSAAAQQVTHTYKQYSYTVLSINSTIVLLL